MFWDIFLEFSVAEKHPLSSGIHFNVWLVSASAFITRSKSYECFNCIQNIRKRAEAIEKHRYPHVHHKIILARFLSRAKINLLHF